MSNVTVIGIGVSNVNTAMKSRVVSTLSFSYH